MATQLGEKYTDDVDDLLNELDDELDSKPAKGRTVTVNSGWGDSDDDDSAKQGRRAKKAPEPDPEPVDDGAAEEMAVSSTMNNDDLSDGPPKPARRKGGWGEESAAGRRRGMDQEDERLRPRSADKSDDDDNEIPTIPDLEDAQDEDMTMQVAMAPNVAVNRVATYRELDNELLRHAAFLTLDNEIDLKILAKGLSAEADVQEIDAPWDWDRLFTEVSSELLTEWEKKEAPEEDVAA